MPSNSVHTHLNVNPSPEFISSSNAATLLNNQALMAAQSGDFSSAEQLHLQAITLKESIHGVDHATTALSYNALGEVYLQLKRLDEAEKFLSKAVKIRNARGTAFDAAVSRENLAHLQELRGNLEKAKEIRLTGAPDKLACGYEKCSGQLFSLNKLKTCGKCKSIFYCSLECQKQDWKARHKPLCKAAA